MAWFIYITFDFDVTELMECTCLVFLHCLQFTKYQVNKENLKLNHCHCQQQVHKLYDKVIYHP